jgi:primosomal protein N' (replication factor Y)
MASPLSPATASVLGPVELDPGPEGEPRERVLIRVPRSDGKALAAALAVAQAARTARKATAPARVRLDPREFA